jgi:hypothetical protein
MLGAHTMEKLSTDCGGDFHCFIGDILKPLQLQPTRLAGGIIRTICAYAAARGD